MAKRILDQISSGNRPTALFLDHASSDGEIRSRRLESIRLTDRNFGFDMVFCGVARQLHITPAGKESNVLRITTYINSGMTRLIVEGRLAGVCIDELEKCWRATASKEPSESILVDLSSVTFVDASGKQLLANMRERGIRLVASGLMAKCLIEEIERSRKTIKTT